ncbi:MAG: hypothetical protein AAF399_24140 [Bacteroidota bacterium]
MRSLFLLFLLLGMASGSSLFAQKPIHPDDTAEAMKQLKLRKEALQSSKGNWSRAEIQTMIELGIWQPLMKHWEQQSRQEPEEKLLQAEMAFRQNDFRLAEELVQVYQQAFPKDPAGPLFRARLHLQAWELEQAENICHKLLKKDAKLSEAFLLLSRLELLKKNYPKALALAQQVQQWDQKASEAYLLEAEAYFWLQKPKKAEPPLRKSLELNPFDPDARFAYGYALWRHVDATLLPAMAAQWEIALAVHPLHYQTHWHWGNGHTHLTYADYVDEQESEIRTSLKKADEFLAQHQVNQAMDHLREVASQYPRSVLPLMHIGSAYFMSYELGPPRLDSAISTFQSVLQRKPHYGPAHNGLAAVIKQQRFSYLYQHDSLEQVLDQTVISDPENFKAVFSDLDQYPGDRVAKMVWNQLYSSVVYFPFLQKLKREFVIPPLHQDLALAMDEPYFRGGTTFDNRQWMDIRGVGSGATGIEYVERGAHLERNVTLHEYVHLFHGSLFTDEEMRATRERYYHAMEHDLTLDYYSANNEFEYLAQTYTAYFLPVKVHPLNHKALNTKSDLKAKDPLLYEWLDQLVNKQEAYLRGDSSAMADTWAQTYLQLANQAIGRQAWEVATAYLDTAWTWDSTYLPLFLAQARLAKAQDKFLQAKRWLRQAEQKQPDHAPIFQAQARLVEAQFLAGKRPLKVARTQWLAAYRQAEELENDWQLRAELNQAYVRGLMNWGMVLEAIEQAEQYATDAPTVSTYLRDKRLESEVFARFQRAQLGYVADQVAFFQQQVALRPQDYRLLHQYGEVLLLAGEYAALDTTMGTAYALLKSTGQTHWPLLQVLVKSQLAQGDTAKARELIQPVLAAKGLRAKREWVELLVQLGEGEVAAEWVGAASEPKFPAPFAQYHYLQALLVQETDQDLFQHHLIQALKQNPYHFPARMKLVQSLHASGATAQARSWARQGISLPLPAGPYWQERLLPFTK